MAKIKHFQANALTISALSLLFAATVCAEANAPTWTTKETEQFWASVIANANCVEITPRLKEANSEKGEGILEAFGTQYMPNAYEYYEKARATAIERGQTLKENFPEGERSDATGGTLYKKVGKATAKAVAEYYRRRDELCHFYLMHKAGLMTDVELAEIDSSKISLMLFDIGEIPSILPTSPKEPTPGELDFARKYKPETFAAYEREKAIFDEGLKDYASLRDDALILDAARAGTFLVPFRLRLDELGELLSQIAKKLKEEKLLHDVDEITAEQLAASDAESGRKARALEKTFDVNGYVKGWFEKNWTQEEVVKVACREAPVVGLPLTMVQIPSKGYAMCKYEVTYALWAAVKGQYPTKEVKDTRLPVNDVSWEECESFIWRLNNMTEVKSSGVKYRLPTEDEWEFACRAGTNGDFCRLRNGRDITEKNLYVTAWDRNSSGCKTHPVGLKEPNAFGLFDMLGNASEWTSTYEEEIEMYSNRKHVFYIYKGGTCSDWGSLTWRKRDRRAKNNRGSGFRLVADCQH